MNLDTDQLPFLAVQVIPDPARSQARPEADLEADLALPHHLAEASASNKVPSSGCSSAE